MSLGIDQELDERAIPIESDGRFRSHLQAPLPVLQQSFSCPHPFRIDKLMPARLKPSPAQIETERQPKPAEPRVCKKSAAPIAVPLSRHVLQSFSLTSPFFLLEDLLP